MLEELKETQEALKKQWVKEQTIECHVCGEDVPIEDADTCESCHKPVCSNCMTIRKWVEDDWAVLCKSCIEAKK